MRSASSEDERAAALLAEWSASLDAFVRAARASAVSPAIRVARVRIGAQSIERAVRELLDLEPRDRREAVAAMRWLKDSSQLRAVVRALRYEIDDLDWIERCGALDNRDLAVEIAESSTRELPAVVEALFVHLGAEAAATLADKARAAQSMVDDAQTGEEISWMASVILALPPKEAQPVARSLLETMEAIERADPDALWNLDDPTSPPRLRVALALAHAGELASAAAVIERWASDQSRAPRAAAVLRRAASLFAPEAATTLRNSAALTRHALRERDEEQAKLSVTERAAFAAQASESSLRAIAESASAPAPGATILELIASSVSSFIEALSDAQRDRGWDAIERAVDRQLIEPAQVLALAPRARVRDFVERHFHSLGGLAVIADALRAMAPGDERAWIARTSIQRLGAEPADASAEFALATALDDESAAMKWLRSRHGDEVPRASMPPWTLVEAIEEAANEQQKDWWIDPPSRILVAHLRHSERGRSVLARAARAAFEAMPAEDATAWDVRRSTLSDLLRFADAPTLRAVVSQQERRREWWLGHGLVVRCRELFNTGQIDEESRRRIADVLRESLGFVPASTLTVALVALLRGEARTLADALPEPPMDRTRWDLLAAARAFDCADEMLAWGALLPKREQLEHGSLLWSVASDAARAQAISWLAAAHRAQRIVGAPCDPRIVAALPVERLVDVWARYGAGTSTIALLQHPAELRRMAGAPVLDGIADALFAALDAI